MAGNFEIPRIVEEHVLSVGFKVKPLQISVLLCLQKPIYILPQNFLKEAMKEATIYFLLIS